MYMNYGLLFVKDQQRLFPKEYECTVFGRNPGLSRLDFARFQNLLGDVSLLLRNPDDLAEVARFLQIQLAVLLEWATDRQALVKRVAQGGHLEMIVDRPALGLTA